MLTDVTGPPFVDLDERSHLLEPLLEAVRARPRDAVASVRHGDRFVDVTVASHHARVTAVAKGLVASGVAPGDRVALMAHTRLEWLVVDQAVLMVGGITVPIYDTSSAAQVAWIVADSGAVLLLVETAEMRSRYEGDGSSRAGCREVLTIDAGALEDLARRGAGVADAVIDERLAGLRGASVATIIYTSGTTGRPKGCVLTHRNLRTNARQAYEAVRSELRPGDSGLFFLPLAHALTKANALFDLEAGVTMAFATDIAHLPEELALARPTTIAAVPRIFEKVYNGAAHRARTARTGAIFDRATAVAIRWSRQRTAGRVRPWTAVAHRAFDALVYTRIRHALGGRLRLAISGGGPLGERLTHYFAGVGVQIYEGYGLTETSPTLTLNHPGAWKPGTVGRPLPGTSLRIAPDGEILAKGPQVFAGYWRDDVATAEAFDEDGWFRTGDIGELDDDGYLRITGRKKDLIVTAAGKNVAPAPLEDRLRSHELISQAVVVGEGRPFVSALVTIDEASLDDWSGEHGRFVGSVAEVLDDRDLLAEIQRAVDDANASVSRAESVRKFVILPHDLTIDAGELTPTLKVRRAVVEQHYAEQIESVYAGS